MKQSVLSAISQSSFYSKDDVRFMNNIASTEAGYTMQFANTKDVRIDRTTFSGNHQTNIAIEAAEMNVTHSNFTDGKNNHISA